MTWLPQDPIRRFIVILAVAFTLLGALAGGVVAWINDANSRDTFLSVGAVILVAWAAVAMVVVVLRRIMVAPIRQFADFMSHLSRGEFGQAAPTFKGSELFGRLGESAARLKEFLLLSARELETVSTKVRRHAQGLAASTQEMNAASEEITSTVQQISRGMETQAARTSEASEIMAGMSRNVQEVAERSANVAEASAQAWETAVAGGESVKQAVLKITEIFEKATESAHAIQGLGRTSKKIGQVVQIITGIADQTNLLALNAAIEAARAGEAGRGFAVVAEEVRKLAEASSRSAAEINKLVKEIQSETDRAVTRMTEGTADLSAGRAVVDSAGASLEEILKVVRRVDDVSKEIFQLTQKQAQDTDQVVKAVEEIAAVAEQTAAGTQQASASTQEQTASMEEMVTAAQELSQAAELLAGVVRRFKAEG